jgi:hypothetical protein
MIPIALQNLAGCWQFGNCFSSFQSMVERPSHKNTLHIARSIHSLDAGPLRCKKKFLRFFADGFYDEDYIEWERGYKWAAHEQWEATLNKEELSSLIRRKEFQEIAMRAVRIESRTNLLFSFEKMAIRDALKSPKGSQIFSTGLQDFLHGGGPIESRFNTWCEVVASLPRKQTRVLTWPLVTIFGFIAQPRTHFFLKPNVTRVAANKYGFDFEYQSRPQWAVYRNLLQFAEQVRRDLKDLRPRDQIDIQSFLWVQGSEEYA